MRIKLCNCCQDRDQWSIIPLCHARVCYARTPKMHFFPSLSPNPILPPLNVSHQLCRPLLPSRIHLRRHLVLRCPTVVVKLVLVVLGPPLRQRWCNLTLRLALVRFERDFLWFRRLPCVAFPAVEQPEDDEGNESCYTDGCPDAGFAAGGEPGGWCECRDCGGGGGERRGASW